MTLDGRDPALDREHSAFAEWDAAYVLGALSPDDRRAYEDHLAGCERCRAAVAELTPLPGLLARAARPARDDGWAMVDDGPHPPIGHPVPAEPGPADDPRADLVDLAAQRSIRHRRRLFAAGIAAVLVVGVAVAVPLATRAPEPAPPAQTVALAARTGTSLTASVGLTPVAWGTRLSMECDYPAASPSYARPPDAGPAVYALVVTDVDGNQSQVSTWSAVPGHDVRLDAATALPIDRIASLEVRSGSGTTLLAADVGHG